VLVVEGTLVTLAVLVLFGHSLSRLRHEKRLHEHIDIAQALVMGTPEGGRPSRVDLKPLRSLPVSIRVEVFGKLNTTMREINNDTAATLADRVGVIDKAKQLCRSRFWWRRLLGVRLLTKFGSGEDAVPILLDDPVAEVRAQVAEWAADHPSPALIDRLLNLLNDPKTLPRFSVQDSLLRMGNPVIPALDRYLSSHSDDDVDAALVVAIGLADFRFLGSATLLCKADRPQTRALAATLLGAVGGEQVVRLLLELLDDPATHVRAAAARSLGKLGHWPAAPRVGRLLRDTSWAVRREAGLALRRLGSPGLLVLRRFLNDDDRFAADMAQQVLDLPDTSSRALAQ
jgi:HEAT repeat protein